MAGKFPSGWLVAAGFAVHCLVMAGGVLPSKEQPMGTLIAFFVERLIVSLPDILLAGGGAFLTASRGWRRFLGITLLLTYSVSITGSFLSGSAPSLDPDDLHSVGIAFGVIAAVGGWLLGRKLRQRSERLDLSPSPSLRTEMRALDHKAGGDKDTYRS